MSVKLIGAPVAASVVGFLHGPCKPMASAGMPKTFPA